MAKFLTINCKQFNDYWKMSNKEEIKEEELNKEETTSQVEENQDVVEENKK